MRTRRAARSRYILFLVIISLLVTACGKTATVLPLPVPTLTPTRYSTPWLQVYFTDPDAPYAHDYEGGPDEFLAEAIDRARLSVDVAAYSLNLWSIRDALIHAFQRGVTVRMVMESDNLDDQEVQDLIGTGIPIVDDQQEGLMHDKFVVIDHSEVWTGSMNYTVSGAYKDNNNLICLRSTQVAEDYTSEFEEMFDDHLFGPSSVANTPNPKITIDGTPVEVLYSPEDSVAARLLELIDGAQESIYFMAYSFTSNEIGNAIVERAQAGVTVAGVLDNGQINSNQGTEYDAFLQAGLDVRQDGNTEGLMHHKVLIIDRQIVVTGSYNFTASAEENNDENVVIIFDPDVAATYLEEFQHIYSLAEP